MIAVGFTILVDPHRRCATNRHRHHDKVDDGDHGKQRHSSAKAKTRATGLIQGKAHILKTDLMVIEGIIAVLNCHHPSAEQEP